MVDRTVPDALFLRSVSFSPSSSSLSSVSSESSYAVSNSVSSSCTEESNMCCGGFLCEEDNVSFLSVLSSAHNQDRNSSALSVFFIYLLAMYEIPTTTLPSYLQRFFRRRGRDSRRPRRRNIFQEGIYASKWRFLCKSCEVIKPSIHDLCPISAGIMSTGTRSEEANENEKEENRSCEACHPGEQANEQYCPCEESPSDEVEDPRRRHAEEHSHVADEVLFPSVTCDDHEVEPSLPGRASSIPCPEHDDSFTVRTIHQPSRLFHPSSSSSLMSSSRSRSRNLNRSSASDVRHQLSSSSSKTDYSHCRRHRVLIDSGAMLHVCPVGFGGNTFVGKKILQLNGAGKDRKSVV